MNTGCAEDEAENVTFCIAVIRIHIVRHHPKVEGRRSRFFSVNLSANDCDTVNIWRHANRMKTKMRSIKGTGKSDLAVRANTSACKGSKW